MEFPYKVMKYCVGELFAAEDVLEATDEVADVTAVVVGDAVADVVAVARTEVVDEALVAVAGTHW